MTDWFIRVTETATKALSLHRFYVAWSALGPLLGVLMGGYLTARSQSRKWVADGKTEEYREVLSAIMKTLPEDPQEGKEVVPPSNESLKALDALASHSLAVIADRLFIADEIERLAVGKKWHHIVIAYSKAPTRENRDELFRVASGLRKEIVDSAKKVKL
jgi:hypothetical protein